jgi:hypothetical protein
MKRGDLYQSRSSIPVFMSVTICKKTTKNFVIFQVLTAASIKMTAFWDIAMSY